MKMNEQALNLKRRSKVQKFKRQAKIPIFY